LILDNLSSRSPSTCWWYQLLLFEIMDWPLTVTCTL
jgi:hypothetical protein